MKNLKKILSLTLAAAMALSMTACGSKETPKTDAPEPEAPAIEENAGTVGEVDKTKTYKEKVYIAYWGDLDSADAYGSNSAIGKAYTFHTFDTLTINNVDTGELEPSLAKEWKDVNGDCKTWDFILEEGVKFHNGDAFTADDVKFTWEYTAVGTGNTIINNPASVYIDSIEVIDDYTVRFNLVDPVVDWPTYQEIKIYNKESFDTMAPEEAGVIGTGPYMYDKSKNISGVSFSAVRNDNYWKGLDNYPTKEIVFKVLLDEDSRVAALQAGEVDLIYNVSASYYDILKSDSNLQVLTRGGANSYYLGFNHAKPKTADINLRKALAMAVNRENIEIISFNGGIGGVASYNFCVPSGAGYSEVDYVEYDPEGAMQLLKENGYEGIKLVLGHTTSTKNIAEVVQADLLSVGVEIELRQVDTTNWTAFKWGDEYDLVTDYAAYQGAMLYNFNRFFRPGAGANMYRYESAEYNAAEDKVFYSKNMDEMKANFAELQQFVADDLPLVPLACGNQIAAARNGVEGVVLAPATPYMNFSTIRFAE